MGWAFLAWLFISGLCDLGAFFIALIGVVLSLIAAFSSKKQKN